MSSDAKLRCNPESRAMDGILQRPHPTMQGDDLSDFEERVIEWRYWTKEHYNGKVAGSSERRAQNVLDIIMLASYHGSVIKSNKAKDIHGKPLQSV
jgi:hypothetical protein